MFRKKKISLANALVVLGFSSHRFFSSYLKYRWDTHTELKVQGCKSYSTTQNWLMNALMVLGFTSHCFFPSYLKHRLDAHTQVKVEGLIRNHVLQR